MVNPETSEFFEWAKMAGDEISNVEVGDLLTLRSEEKQGVMEIQ